MFSVEEVAVKVSAVRSPQVVEVSFDKKTQAIRSTNKHLAVDCSVLLFYRRRYDVRLKLRRQPIAVAGADNPRWPKFLEDGLFEVIRHTIAILVRAAEPGDLAAQWYRQQYPQDSERKS